VVYCWMLCDSSELMVSTTSSSQSIVESLVGLAWSLWTELGVSGWFRHHEDWGIDLEPLILLTAALGDADPRLRDESTDWCIRYERFVSAARLRTLLCQSDAETRRVFDEFAATVKAYAPVNWRTTGVPRSYQPTGRSRLAELSRASLFAVRQRALFGTGARAEIVRVLASAPDHAFTTAEIAEEAAFTKRAVEQELDSLVLGGVVRRTSVLGRRYVQVARPDVLLPFVGDRPVWIPRWAALVRILLGGLHLIEQMESLPPIVRAVEARRFLNERRHDIERGGLASPNESTVGAAIWDEFDAWFRRVASALAVGDPSVLSMRASG
jgi:hypothetical protein